MGTPARTQQIWRFGIFEIDALHGELRRNGRPIKLQDQPLRVLILLLKCPGELITREMLHRELWPADTFVDFDTGLNTAIRKLRQALGDSANHPLYIETRARHGYRFIAPVTCLHADADEALTAPAAEGPKWNVAAIAVQDVTAAAPQETPAASANLTEIFRERVIRVRWAVLWGTLALAVFVFALVFIQRSIPARAAGPKIRSLAVLPLKNLSGDPAQEYFADGMTEALIGRLSTISGLRVISRTSTMHFKESSQSIPEIAKALHVDAVVEGSVMRDSDRVRVNAQLIRGSTDEHFWSESYDRELRDTIALQSEVARAIASKIEVTVTGQEQEQLAAVRPVSPEVYELYLKGRSALDNANSKGTIEESLSYFEEAIRRDSQFALAYVGVAEAHDWLSTIFIGGSPQEERRKVLSAAQKALELDPNLAEAHDIIGQTLQRQWRWAEAEAEFHRALALKPSDALAHGELATWLMCQGRFDESLQWEQRARKLDPLTMPGTDVAFILLNARRYNESIRELRSAIAARPNYAFGLWMLGTALIASNRSQEAVPVLEKAVALTNRSPGIVGELVDAYAHMGQRADALRLLDELKRRKQTGYVSSAAFVTAYLGLGDREQAFFWMEQAYREQSNMLQFLKGLPNFDPVRDDLRFVDLVRRVGLN